MPDSYHVQAILGVRHGEQEEIFAITVAGDMEAYEWYLRVAKTLLDAGEQCVYAEVGGQVMLIDREDFK